MLGTVHTRFEISSGRKIRCISSPFMQEFVFKGACPRIFEILLLGVVGIVRLKPVHISRD
jgi:hypothetical protein